MTDAVGFLQTIGTSGPVRRRGMLLAALVPLSACYTFQPAAVSPRLGTYVSVELTDHGTAQLGRLLGMGVTAVEGHLHGSTERELSLAVRGTRQRNGVENIWAGEPVALPRESISGVRERKFSRRRTATAVGGAVAALVLIWQGVQGFGASPGSGGGPPAGQ